MIAAGWRPRALAQRCAVNCCARRLLSSKTSAATERGVIRIGDVAAPLGDAPKRPSLIPQVACNTSDPSALGTVQWLMKKAILRQDALLLGNHPAAMRALVTQFANVMERETEFVSITRDTTESDLKQRRELTGGSVLFVNQPVVEAAINGRLLVIEGLEKAERNVRRSHEWSRARAHILLCPCPCPSCNSLSRKCAMHLAWLAIC